MARFFRELPRRLRGPLDQRRALARILEFHEQPRSIDEMVRRAMNFGTRGLYKVRTAQVPSEITALVAAVAELRPQVTLEIGTARGGTLFLWSQLTSERVVSCDIKDRPGLKRIAARFPPPGSNCSVELLTGDSHDPEFADRVSAKLGGQPVDFLFLDGDHSEAGVEADFQRYGPLVRPEGVIAFHDIVEKQPVATNQVHPFWKRIKQAAEHREFVENQSQVGFGIGLLRVPGEPQRLFAEGRGGAATPAAFQSGV